MLVFIDCVHCHSVMFIHLNKLECVNMPLALHFLLLLHLSISLHLQCILWNKVFLVWKLYWSSSASEMIICCTRVLSTKFWHSDYIILTFTAEFVCPACSDFITSSYLNAPEALTLHTNGFSLYFYGIHCVHCYKHPHLTWPQFWCHTAHTWIKTIFWWWQ